MKIGLNTDSLGTLGLDETLDVAAGLGLDAVEFGLGGWSSAPHVAVGALLADAAARDRLSGLATGGSRSRRLTPPATRCIPAGSARTTRSSPTTPSRWRSCSASDA
jgi:hypothetical protein